MKSLLVIILLLTLTGCSGTVDGVAREAGPQLIVSQDGKATVRNPRRLQPSLNCEKVLPLEEVSAALGATASAPKEQDKAMCQLTLSGSVSGGGGLVRTGTGKGEKAQDFEGNTTFMSTLGGETCSLSVAVGRIQYLVGTMNLLGGSGDSTKACELARALLKVAFDRLPKGDDG